MLTKLMRRFGLKEKRYWLRIPRENEFQHTLLLGDSGTGKSQIIHSFLRQIASRRPAEAAIVYDPACEFIKRHYSPERGDIILNPLDLRSPFWSPTLEVEYQTDYKLVSESFFPGKENSSPTAQFFVTASRSIFSRMLEFSPTPEQIVDWLQNAKEIDRLVKGTEHAHYIDHNAGNQRGGVLGSMAEVGAVLKLLPNASDCRKNISLTRWAKHRKGWIFITSINDTRDALRPLQAVFLNILLKRLMSCDAEWGSKHPCWVVVDEVHSLKRLPALEVSLSEGRKFGVKIVLGTQGKSQFEQYYGTAAETMLATPNLKILFRTNEPRAAKWISDLIGEAEKEKERTSTNAAVNDNRDSIHYSTYIEQRAVVSKEEIMGLRNLCGYWKYGSDVVGFRFPYNLSKQVAE
ncbi:MAG TPA: type IV secretion system DNA-binding domain-containing protein, partial [Blastocatellia bacterium]|nr:type IV secretion system DNA-binding domain-containing protein [Blastocatellia bacterium]